MRTISYIRSWLMGASRPRVEEQVQDYRDRYASRSQVLDDARELAGTLHPHDIELNEMRADWGQAAVMVGCPDFAVERCGIRADIEDALGNIAHFCARAGLDPEEVFAGGLATFDGDAEDGAPPRRDAAFGCTGATMLVCETEVSVRTTGDVVPNGASATVSGTS